jgi:hypothetical protein
MTPRDRTAADRRAALGWIAGQLAWETRLQTLRTDPEGEGADDADGAHGAETGELAAIDPAA